MNFAGSGALVASTAVGGIAGSIGITVGNFGAWVGVMVEPGGESGVKVLAPETSSGIVPLIEFSTGGGGIIADEPVERSGGGCRPPRLMVGVG